MENMTKEEKIKKALGDLCQYADVNGWIPFAFGITRNLKDSDLDKSRVNDKLVIRPKSLSGIENNNGWIKIESESDLPKIGEYDMSCFELFYYADKRVIKAKYCTGLVLDITHYRLEPLIKPLAPIY